MWNKITKFLKKETTKYEPPPSPNINTTNIVPKNSEKSEENISAFENDNGISSEFKNIPQSKDNNFAHTKPQFNEDEYTFAAALFKLRKDIGENIVFSRAFINALDDYKAFSQSKPSHAILKVMITDGSLVDFISIAKEDNLQNHVNQFTNRINTKYGFIESIIKKLLWEILLGLSKCTPEEIYLSQNDKTTEPKNEEKPDIDHFKDVHKFYDGNPPYEILTDGTYDIPTITELRNTVDRLSWILSSFNVEVQNIIPVPGPFVSIYEIDIENKHVGRIVRNEKNILSSLSIQGSRLVNPLPNKLALGFEIPNEDFNGNTLKIGNLIHSDEFKNSEFILPIALGFDGYGKPLVKDLASLGHLLITGNSQTGKSSLLRNIIISLILKSTSKVKFIIGTDNPLDYLDFEKLPYFFFCSRSLNVEKIFEDRFSFKENLPSIYQEILNRKSLFKQANVTSLQEYNKSIGEGKLSQNTGHRFLPHLICIVDEKKTFFKSDEFPVNHVEEGNYYGVHFIFTTKYSDSSTLTSTVLNTLNTRIAFKHSIPGESRRVIHNDHALNLLPKGDALLLENGIISNRFFTVSGNPEDSKQLFDFISTSPYPENKYILPERESMFSHSSIHSSAMSEKDPLYDEIKQYVISCGIASTSNIQRKYQLGYNRAGRIMDLLEAEGIVGPSQGGKPRSILVAL